MKTRSVVMEQDLGRLKVSLKANKLANSPFTLRGGLAFMENQLLTDQELVASEVRHRDRKIHSRVNEFSQNLHVGNMAVEAEKESLNSRGEHARFLPFRGPTGEAIYVVQRLFVLQ